MCTHVDNQRSRGVVIARLQSYVRSLLHQRHDLHQSIYLYLTEDQEPTFDQLALASPHCKINWSTCSNVVLPSSPLNLENSGTL
jgi:hypothetical protein